MASRSAARLDFWSASGLRPGRNARELTPTGQGGTKEEGEKIDNNGFANQKNSTCAFPPGNGCTRDGDASAVNLYLRSQNLISNNRSHPTIFVFFSIMVVLAWSIDGPFRFPSAPAESRRWSSFCRKKNKVPGSPMRPPDTRKSWVRLSASLSQPQICPPPPSPRLQVRPMPPFFYENAFYRAPFFVNGGASANSRPSAQTDTRARCHMRPSGRGGKKLGNPRYERLGERGITRRKGVRCGRCPGSASRPHADAKGEHTLRREPRRRT